MVQSVCGFITKLNITEVELSGDGEPAIVALIKAVKAARLKESAKFKTHIPEASLRDSANNGAIQATVRWWQQKVRTFRYHTGEKYGRS